jgi:hypothetical protein
MSGDKSHEIGSLQLLQTSQRILIASNTSYPTHYQEINARKAAVYGV